MQVSKSIKKAKHRDCSEGLVLLNLSKKAERADGHYTPAPGDAWSVPVQVAETRAKKKESLVWPEMRGQVSGTDLLSP